ncbi:hypothetical protein FQN50_001739 [Emmonsiellopsis sp. PD_5]|nr:hypothetical protein FQN50_001739 [Emmonsiellopsis sp. PD_5]
MGYCRLCLLCGKTIDSKCSGKGVDAWRAVYQVFQFEVDAAGRSSLVRPSNIYIPVGTRYVTHSACWSVLQKAFAPGEIGHEWLERFCLTLHDLQPFLAHIPFPESPEFVDSDLDGDFGNGARSDKACNTRGASNTGVFSRFFLPNEIVQAIYSHLDNYEDVSNLQQAALIEPDTRKWLELGRRYIAYGYPFTRSTTDMTSETIRRALRNLHNYPCSRFPHTVNYGTVWENAELITGKINQPLLGLDLDTGIDVPQRHALRSSLSSGLAGKKLLRLKGSPRVSFNFNQVRDRRYLCGFQLDDNISGYEGDSSITVPLGEFCGLRLVSDGHGFISLQVKKNTSTWDPHWYGDLPENDTAQLAFATMEWPSCHDISLAIFLDTFKVHTLFYISDSFSPPNHPTVWYSRLPSQTLTPVVLVDRNPLDAVLPSSFIDEDLEKFAAASAFVDVYTQSITGFELADKGGINVLIGRQHPLTSKLSFHVNFEAGETLTGLACAEANINSGVAVKFFTNHGRSVIFGDPTASNWHVTHSPNGVFCTSNTYQSFVPVSMHLPSL